MKKTMTSGKLSAASSGGLKSDPQNKRESGKGPKEPKDKGPRGKRGK